MITAVVGAGGKTSLIRQLAAEARAAGRSVLVTTTTHMFIEEDTLCAEYIQSLLEGKPLENMPQRMADLKNTSGAKFFDPNMQSVFPKRDFELCVQLDTVPFVLRLTRDEESGLGCMERVDVL